MTLLQQARRVVQGNAQLQRLLLVLSIVVAMVGMAALNIPR